MDIHTVEFSPKRRQLRRLPRPVEPKVLHYAPHSDERLTVVLALIVAALLWR